MLKLGFVGIWFFLCCSSSLQAQEELGSENLRTSLLNLAKANPDEYYFRKAMSSFFSEDWNTTLLFSFKQLEKKNSSLEVRDWCYYLRGVSFKKKHLYEAASQSLKCISLQFPFKHFILIHQGGITLERGQYQKAIYYFKKVEHLSFPKSDYKRSALLQNIGICYLHLKNYRSAEVYLHKSTRSQELDRDTIGLVSSYMNIANLYYAQFIDNKAIPYFEKAYNMSKRIRNFELKQNAALNMAIVEENRNKPWESIKYRKEFENWRDSLNNQNRIWKLAQAEQKFKVDQKLKQIRLLRVENRLKQTEQNISLFSLGFLFLLISLAGYFLWQQSKSKRIILAQKKHVDELNLTKDKLFSVVSHDLRSSVNALKSSNNHLSNSLYTKDLEELEVLLKTNSSLTNGVHSLLDNLLNWAMLQTRQLYFYREPIHLKSAVEQVLFNYTPVIEHKKMKAICSVHADVVVMVDLDSLKVVLRNLFDNAIKFSNENGTLKIYTINESVHQCNLVIEDTGLGMSERTLQTLRTNKIVLPNEREHDRAGTGLGLQLCKEMMEKNQGTLDIESAEGKGTKIQLSLIKK